MAVDWGYFDRFKEITDEDGNYIHTGHWKFAESQVWRPEGAKMFLRLLRMWNEEGGE